MVDEPGRMLYDKLFTNVIVGHVYDGRVFEQSTVVDVWNADRSVY